MEFNYIFMDKLVEQHKRKALSKSSSSSGFSSPQQIPNPISELSARSIH